MIKVGDKVLYRSEKYEVIFIYDSGYIEIKKVPWSIELVHVSEVSRRKAC